MPHGDNNDCNDYSLVVHISH